MKVICKERPNGDILYDFTERGSEQKLKDQPFTLKEKCEYKIEVAFRVQHEIVAGLKFINLVFRKGVRGTVIWRLPQHIDGVFSNHDLCPHFP